MIFSVNFSKKGNFGLKNRKKRRSAVLPSVSLLIVLYGNQVSKSLPNAGDMREDSQSIKPPRSTASPS